MNSILVATDFSENAQAAAEYAIMLAKETNAKVILFHSFSILFPVPNIPKEIRDKDEYGKAVENELQKLAISLSNIAPDLQIEHICKPGFPVDSITEIVKERNIDLVVMGIKKLDYINEIIAGSFTTDIIMKASFPVMVVPAKTQFSPIKNIVLACDCHEIKNYDSLALIKEIAQHFNARIKAVHINKVDENVNDLDKEAVRCNLEEYFTGFEFSYHEFMEDDLTLALNDFTKKIHAQLTVTIPGKHSFFESIFSGSHTKELAFHTHIPLLALPDIG